MYKTKSGRIVMKNNDGFDYKEVFESNRNWNDVSSIYLNHCKDCDKKFFGNKYRIVCKECHPNPNHFPQDGKYFNTFSQTPVDGKSNQLVCNMCGSSKLEDCGSGEYACEDCGHFPITS
jgi:hypothetical protein